MDSLARVGFSMFGLRIARTLVVLLTLSACSGGDSGGSSSFADEGAVCEQERTTIDGLEQVVEALGFSPAEVLAFSQKEHQTTLRWLPTDRVRYGPESGDVRMVVGVLYEGGAIEFIDSTLRAVGGSLLDDDSRCVDALAVEVEVTLETAEGALRERFTAELRASAGTATQIVHEVNLDALAGAFEITHIEGSGFLDGASVELRQPTFQLHFSELGAEGRFESLYVESSSDSGVATGNLVEFARWPAGGF